VDRDSIERRDFPVGRRGYDPAAVDAHLRRVADEFETLRKHPASSPLAAGASEQVRLILEAAEASAEQMRADAAREASDRIGRVEEAVAGMLSRLDELESELGTLLDGLRRSGARLNEGLAQLRREAASVPAAPADESVAPADEVVAGASESVAPAGEVVAGASESVAPADEVVAGASESVAPADEIVAGSTANGDETGARLIALNMALSGTPREETARYLAEHFALADADGLLDDVYARAGR
jgi:DivIVA domain-containing protein